jgi:hypothetical protein
MGESGLDKHLLAGLDDRERGFSRPVEFERTEADYRAILRYETVRVASEPAPTQGEALQSLIRTLQAQGYRQLKTQISFRNGVYLGARELWIEYADPPPAERDSRGLIDRFLNWLRPHDVHGQP